MRLILVVIALLSLAGCGDTYLRIQPTDTTPAVYFVTSAEAEAAHGVPSHVAQAAAQGAYPSGITSPDGRQVWILTEDPDHLSPAEALVLTHELQHVADRRFGGSMWALLRAMNCNTHPAGKETP